jgi:HSP20 family protein
MALLPARRNGTLSRPGSQAPTRWDPFAEFEDLYQRMGQLLSGASDGWRPAAQSLGAAGRPVRDRPGLAGRSRAARRGEGRHQRRAGRPGTGHQRGVPGLRLWHARPAGRRGRRTGRFEYRVLLPGQAEADKITAALADGVLTVTVPKTEAGKPRRIQITD